MLSFSLSRLFSSAMDFCKAGIVSLALSAALATPSAAESEMLTFLPEYLPNIAGFAAGRVPDYLGSDDGFIGAAPAFRVSWGKRFVELRANYMTANLLDHPHWQVGPAGLLRFGRDSVDDAAVRHLPEIDDTIELGAFVTYQFNPTPDLRDSWAFSAQFLHDVLGVHKGFTLSASAQRWVPVFRYSALGFSLATTYGSRDYLSTFFSVSPAAATASGLRQYDLGGGMRDVRAGMVFVQPLSPSVLVGAGMFYSRLVGDVAQSPIVSDRGSRNQLFYGVGALFTF